MTKQTDHAAAEFVDALKWAKDDFGIWLNTAKNKLRQLEDQRDVAQSSAMRGIFAALAIKNKRRLRHIQKLASREEARIKRIEAVLFCLDLSKPNYEPAIRELASIPDWLMQKEEGDTISSLATKWDLAMNAQSLQKSLQWLHNRRHIHRIRPPVDLHSV